MRAARSGWRTMSWPRISTLPASGRIRPVSWRTRVDLPAPFGPSRPKISPRRMSRVTSSVARTSGVAGTPRPAAYRQIGLGQSAHRAHGIATGSKCLCRARTHKGRDYGVRPSAPPSGPPISVDSAAGGTGRARGSVRRGGALGRRTDVDLAPESRPDRVPVVLVDLVVLVGEQPEAGGVAQQLAVDAVRDAGYIPESRCRWPWSPRRSSQRRANTCPTSYGSPPTVVMSSSRSAQRCSAVVSWARVGMEAASAGSAAGRSTQPLSEDQRRVAEVGGCGAAWAPGRAGRRGPWGWGRLWRVSRVPRCRCARRRTSWRARAPRCAARRRRRGRTRAAARRGSRRSRGGARAGRADPAEFLGAHRLGDPGTVQDAALVGLGDQVLGLVVVAVGGLDGPQVDGDAVLLGRHHAGQQIAVAGDEDHVGAGAVAGQLGQLGVHGGVHTLLRPAPVTAGEGAEPDGDAGHHPQPAVLGLGHPVGGAVEPVDAQQGLLRVGLGALAQALDEGGVIDGDAGA